MNYPALYALYYSKLLFIRLEIHLGQMKKCQPTINYLIQKN